MQAEKGDELDPRSMPGPNQQKPNSQYQFNAEEMRVLRECNRESFFQRCLPISTILGGGLYYGVKAGFIPGHTKYGAVPKVVLGVVVGYFVGKFSYRNKCAEKLMLLPNSPIGEMLRQRKRGGFQENADTGFGPSISLSPFSGMTPAETYTDLPQKNSLDLDTSRPDVGGLDDAHRPSMDNPVFEEEEMPPVRSSTHSYEELRKKNREEYQQKRIGSYRSTPSDYLEPVAPLQNSPPPREEPAAPKAQTNKYGDSWS